MAQRRKCGGININKWRMAIGENVNQWHRESNESNLVSRRKLRRSSSAASQRGWRKARWRLRLKAYQCAVTDTRDL